MNDNNSNTMWCRYTGYKDCTRLTLAGGRACSKGPQDGVLVSERRVCLAQYAATLGGKVPHTWAVEAEDDGIWYNNIGTRLSTGVLAPQVVEDIRY